MKQKPFFITEERPHQTNKPSSWYRAYCVVAQWCDDRSKRVRSEKAARQAWRMHANRHHPEVPHNV